jgi:hypothetical protein
VWSFFASFCACVVIWKSEAAVHFFVHLSNGPKEEGGRAESCKFCAYWYGVV